MCADGAHHGLMDMFACHWQVADADHLKLQLNVQVSVSRPWNVWEMYDWIDMRGLCTSWINGYV